MFADEEWVRCKVKLCSYEWGGRVLFLVLARSRFLRLRKLLFAVDLGRVAVNSGHRGNKRYTGDFRARTRKNLKSPSPESMYLTPRIGLLSSEWLRSGPR